MIELYLSSRENLKGLVLVMDIRREWTEDEELLKQFAGRIQLPICVVLTKSDKCGKKEKNELHKKQTQLSQLTDLFPVSSQTKEGIAEVEEFIYRQWILPSQKGSK